MLRTISLFSGAGGLDLGFDAAGFTAAVAVECDPAALDTLRHPDNRDWWRNTKILDKPVETISSQFLLRSAGLKSGDAELLIGGPPCQPFSKSGYWHSGDAKRLNDPRAGTLDEYLRILEDTLPEVFLLENVPGLAFSDKDEGLQLLWEKVDAINRKAGTRYRICATQLNAVDFGVPQSRERVFVIGHRDGKAFRFPQRTHQRPPKVDMSNGRVTAPSRTKQGGLEPCTTAWDALREYVGDNDPELAVRGKWADLLPSIPEAHNYLFHTDRGGGEEIFGWRRRYWSMLLKLAKNRPSWTLTAQPGPAIGPFHWENRRLSARELCALQTFPKKYAIAGNLRLVYRQLGNAVPSALAELLALEIRRQLLGEPNVRRELTLVPRRAAHIPAESETEPVAEKYLPLIGRESEHPGEGKGPGAKRRGALA